MKRKKHLFPLAMLVPFLLLVGTFLPQAHAGSFIFEDCGPRPDTLSAGTVTKIPSSAPFVGGGCYDPPYASIGFEADSKTYSDGDRANFKYTAKPGSRFTGARFFYASRSNRGFQSRFLFNDAGGAGAIVVDDILADGGAWATDFQLPAGQGRTLFRGTLRCEQTQCVDSPHYLLSARTQAWNIGLTVDDFTPPGLVDMNSVGSTLLDPGPVSGTRTLEGVGLDQQSGISSLIVFVNGFNLAATKDFACDEINFSPCVAVRAHTFNFDTTQPPFVEGNNTINVCAFDYGTIEFPNHSCAAVRSFVVDN